MIRLADPKPTDDGFDAALHLEPARWYDPTVGRWLNEEPIAFADVNFYRHVGNVASDATQNRLPCDDRE